MLDDFDSSLVAFKAAGNANRALNAGGHIVVEVLDSQYLAMDLENLSLVLRDLHIAGLSDATKFADSTQAAYVLACRESGRKLDLMMPADAEIFARHAAAQQRNHSGDVDVGGKFVAVFKSFLLIARAYQDAIYRVGLLSFGQKANRKSSSMSKACKVSNPSDHGNPVARLLSEELPEYSEWYRRTRDLRNRIKEGASGFAYSQLGPNNEITFGFELHQIGTDNWADISLRDATEVLSMSARLTTTVINAGVRSGRLVSQHTVLSGSV